MKAKTLYKELADISIEADAKMLGGEKKYGVYNPDKCERDLFQEMIEENLDSINYARMEILKLRRTRGSKGFQELIDQLFDIINDTRIMILRIKRLREKEGKLGIK